jgi:hypothetical protein
MIDFYFKTLSNARSLLLYERSSMTVINAYSVARFGGPETGITLSDHQYRAGGKESAVVAVGRFGLRLDAFAPCSVNDRAGLKYIDAIEIKSLTHRATLRQFVVLRCPDTPPPYLVVFVNWRSAIDQVARLDHKYSCLSLNLHQGTIGGVVVQQSDAEAVVQLPFGQTLTVFYSDGAVRTFVGSAGGLREKILTTLEQFTYRAMRAREQVAVSERPEEITGLWRGMIDLLYLSTLNDHRGIGRLLRQELIRTFFTYLPRPVVDAVQLEFEKVGRDLNLVREVAQLYRAT